MIRILQIVPPPQSASGGVVGYAAALARALRERTGIDSELVEGVEPLRLPDSGPILVHYVNYGYQRRGCPTALVDALAGWRAAGPGRRLVTFFHEVYADGPPWRSSFWTSPIQRRLAGRLARASDGVGTSLGIYAGLLRRLVPGVKVIVLPVFSTVGEPAEVPGFPEREPTLVVFGGEGARRRAWQEGREALEAALRDLRIERVVDVGPALPEIPGRIGGIPVEALGVLPDSEVSRGLRSAAAAFLAYPLDFLPKSTIFAACCAHGAVPVCAGEDRGLEEPLPPFWSPGSPQDPAELAAAAHRWYREHALDRQVEVFRRLLGVEAAAA